MFCRRVEIKIVGFLLTFVCRLVIGRSTINHLYMKTVNTENWFYNYREDNKTLNVVHLTQDGCLAYEGLFRGIERGAYEPYSSKEIAQLINEGTRVVINNLDAGSYIELLDLELFNGVGALWIHGAFHPFDLSSLAVGSSRFHLLNVNGNFRSPQTEKFAGYVTPKIYVEDYSACGNIDDVVPGESNISFIVSEGCRELSVRGASNVWASDLVSKISVKNSATVNIGDGGSSYEIRRFGNGVVELEGKPLTLKCPASFAEAHFPRILS